MDKKYFPYIDVIRICSMFFIIILHSASYGLRAYYFSKTWWVLNIITSVGTCAVPLFFMISGAMLLTSPKTDDIGIMLKKRLPRLAVPLLFWSLACILRDFYYIYKNLHRFDLSELFTAAVKIISAPAAVHLWFMYAIIPLYIIAPFIRRIMDEEKLVKYLIVLWLTGCTLKTFYIAAPENIKMYFDFDLFNKLGFIDGFLGYFVLGAFLHRGSLRLKNRLALPLIFILTAIIAAGTYYSTAKSDSYSEIFKSYTSIWVILLSCLIYLAAVNIHNIPDVLRTTVSYLSSISMGIYMSGNFFLGIMRQEGMTFDTAKGFLLCTVYTAALCIASNSIFMLIKPLCFAATGNKYKSPLHKDKSR